MNLISCTLTGVDRWTDLTQLQGFAQSFPFAEFAVLFSQSARGSRTDFQPFRKCCPCWTPGHFLGLSTCVTGLCLNSSRP
jgi:hypothetical protein